MSGPLAGVRIVDLSERSPAAAIAGMVLSDYGAAVTRLEPPGGDPLGELEAAQVWFRGQRRLQVGRVGPEELDELCRSADVLLDTLHARRNAAWTGPAGDQQIVCLLTA